MKLLWPILWPIDWCVDREYSAQTNSEKRLYYWLGKLYIMVVGMSTGVLISYIATEVLGVG